jgi:hypothetical protein
VLFRGGEGCGWVACGVAVTLEGAAEGEAIARRSQDEAVRGFLLHPGCDAGPSDDDGVTVGVEHAIEMEEVRAGFSWMRGVFIGVRPIGGIHRAGAVWKLEYHRDGALDPDTDHVLDGVAAGIHRDLLPAPFEFAVQSAAPQVESLLDEADVFELFDGEADAAEVQAVKVLAEPIEERLLSVARCRVPDVTAESVEFGEA